MTSRIRFAASLFTASAALLAGAAAQAHVSLQSGSAVAGNDYQAVFRVGHACAGAQATTGIAVRLPAGFALADAQARKGWKLDVQKAGAAEVRWTAESPQDALPGTTQGEFTLNGKLPAAPGPLWFKVLQTCDTGSTDWAQLPASGTSTAGLAAPAARLDVLPVGTAAVDVRDAWVRAAVPGQSGTGAFMKLTAPAGARLVGASTPVAGVAEVHEMKMEGDTMRMREVKGVELPARQTVELKPGGFHLMLMDLKQPITQGKTVPVTLQFEDAKGVRSSLDVQVPVRLSAPGNATSAPAHHH